MSTPQDSSRVFKKLRHRIWLTWLGILAERIAGPFWPAWTVLFFGVVARELSRIGGLGYPYPQLVSTIFTLATAGFIISGMLKFRWPGLKEAIDRLDSSNPDRPLFALRDTPAFSVSDKETAKVWKTHLSRMAKSAENSQVVAPRPRISGSDPLGLRFLAVLLFAVVFLFHPAGNISAPVQRTGVEPVEALSEPELDAWVKPPAYTGRPPLYLNDLSNDESVLVPIRSEILVYAYGSTQEYELRESVSDNQVRMAQLDVQNSLIVTQSGNVSIVGPEQNLGVWEFNVIPDNTPIVEVPDGLTSGSFGNVTVPLRLTDDYGIEFASARVELDIGRVERTGRLVLEPEAVSGTDIPIDLPFGLVRAEINTKFEDYFGDHPWAGLPTVMTFAATDGAGQRGARSLRLSALPGREFTNHISRFLIEQRRDLFWNRAHAPEVASSLSRAMDSPEVSSNQQVLLLLTTSASLLITELTARGEIGTELRNDVGELLWQAAIHLEEGDLAQLREMLRMSGERMSEVLRNNASLEEIERLLAEYLQAMNKFLQQASADSSQNNDMSPSSGETQTLNPAQLRQALERLAELLQQGRTEEAAMLLQQLRSMTEYARPGGSGQGFGTVGNALGSILREQRQVTSGSYQILKDIARLRTDPGLQRQLFQLAERQGQLSESLGEIMSQLLEGSAFEDAELSELLGSAAGRMRDARDFLGVGNIGSAFDRQNQASRELSAGIRRFFEQFGDLESMISEGSGQFEFDPTGRNSPNPGWYLGENLVPETSTDLRVREYEREIMRRTGDEFREEVEIEYLKRLIDRY